MNHAGSFFRFLLGFCTFISVSFGVTYAANILAAKKDVANTQAAAAAEMLR